MLKKLMLFFVALTVIHFNADAAHVGLSPKAKAKYKRMVRNDRWKHKGKADKSKRSPKKSQEAMPIKPRTQEDVAKNSASTTFQE